MTALGRLLEACERATDHLHATYSDSLAAGCDPSDIHKACPVALELDRAVEAVQKAVGEGAVMLPAALVKDLCFDLAVRSDICGMKLFRALKDRMNDECPPPETARPRRGWWCRTHRYFTLNIIGGECYAWAATNGKCDLRRLREEA